VASPLRARVVTALLLGWRRDAAPYTRFAFRTLLYVGLPAFVLVKGVIGMAQQKDLTGRRSQDLMRKRVLFQAIAILIVVLLLLMSGN